MPGAAFLALVLLLGSLFAFALPFFAPESTVPIYSTAWLGGADNRVATVGLAGLACIVLVVTFARSRSWRGRAEGGDASGQQLPRTWLLVGALVAALWTLVWGALIVRSGLRVGETNYFLEQTRNAAGLGLPRPMLIYRDLEFPYGPLLLEPPVWLWKALAPMHLSLAGCYVLVLAVWNVLGLALVFVSLNLLPMRGWARRLLFGICLLETLHPLFGPNYSLGKFALPIAVLLWGGARHSPAGRLLALALGLFVCLMASPELALGLAAAIAVLAVTGAVRNSPGRARSLVLLLAIPAAYGGFVLLYGVAFLDRLRHASGGALNLIVQPVPDVLVFAFAVLWLAPVAVGLALGRQPVDKTLDTAPGATGPTARPPNPLGRDPASILLGLFVLALGLLPGALGRADPLHVFFNGLPFLMLSLCLPGFLSFRRQYLWAAALVVLALWVQAANYEIYARSLREVLVAQRHPTPETLDIARLEQDTGGSPVAAPVLYGIAVPDELALRRAHLLVADPAPGLAEIWDGETERQHIRQLRESQWALVPTGPYLVTERLKHDRPAPSGTLPQRLLQSAGHALLGFEYPERHTPFSVGALVRQEIATNWTPVGRFGSLELYRRLR